MNSLCAQDFIGWLDFPLFGYILSFPLVYLMVSHLLLFSWYLKDEISRPQDPHQTDQCKIENINHCNSAVLHTIGAGPGANKEAPPTLERWEFQLPLPRCKLRLLVLTPQPKNQLSY